MATFTVVYDTCALFPAALRDLLVRLARTGVFRAQWSDSILDELDRSLARKYPDMTPEQHARRRALLQTALPDARVTGHEPLLQGLVLPDPDDRHVLAAAIRIQAQAIVTFDLGHFPEEVLHRYGIEPQHPDQFVRHTLDLAQAQVLKVVREQAAATTRPRLSEAELVTRLEGSGLAISGAKLRELLDG